MKQKIIALLMMLLATWQITSCAQTRHSKEQNIESKKTLVAFFSRAGENYGVGNIEKGNTHIIAEMIAAETGSDLFHILPVTSYPSDYTECTTVAKRELNANARPTIQGDAAVEDSTSSSSVIPSGGVICRCPYIRSSKSTTGKARPSSRSALTKAAGCPAQKTN